MKIKKCDVCGSFQPCPEYAEYPILCQECMISISGLMQREMAAGRETHLKNYLKVKDMETTYMLKPLNVVYETLSQIFPEFPPSDEVSIEKFHAVLKIHNSQTLFPKLNRRFILFNTEDNRLGVSQCNIETDLTLDASSDEIKAAMDKLYAFHHKQLSIIVYRELQGKKELLQ